MASKLKIIYSPSARKELLRIDKVAARRIVLKIEDNSKQKDPLTRAKPLSGILAGRYRYRIGNYRAIFSIDTSGKMSILMILDIKHRKDIYR